jgi:hypothetical protein
MPEDGSALTTSHRLYKAAMFISDAQRGDSIRSYRTGKWTQMLDRLHHNVWYRWYDMHFITFLHSSSFVFRFLKADGWMN